MVFLVFYLRLPAWGLLELGAQGYVPLLNGFEFRRDC
jgi:hypothetical protein